MKPSLPSLLVLALLSGGAALAQSTTAPATDAAPAMRAHHPHDSAKQMKHLTKKLGLSPEQSAQLQPIFADREQKLQALAADTSLDPKSANQQRHAISRDAEQKLNAILTPAQQQQFNAMRASHHHGHHGQPATATPPAAA